MSKISQKILIDKITRVFDKFLTPMIRHENLVYQDSSPCDVLVANVYYIPQGMYSSDGSIYLVESSEGKLKFRCANILEVFNAIVTISDSYKIYGKCYNLYNKIRRKLYAENYEDHTIHLDSFNDNSGKFIMDLFDTL